MECYILTLWWDEVGERRRRSPTPPNHETTMLIGEYVHTLDSKKRLSLPAKFRKEIGRKVVITRGLDACLFMFPEKAWGKIAQKLQELPIGAADTRGMGRFLLSGATESDVDGAGRILIPDYLKDFAKLKTKVVIAGVLERVEIWNEGNWTQYKRQMETKADSMAQKLGDLGVL